MLICIINIKLIKLCKLHSAGKDRPQVNLLYPFSHLCTALYSQSALFNQNEIYFNSVDFSRSEICVLLFGIEIKVVYCTLAGFWGEGGSGFESPCVLIRIQ